MNSKTALVVGGNGGIGASIVERLLWDGMRVGATYFNNRQNIDLLQAKFSGEKLLAFQGDVLSESAMKSVVGQALDHFKKIDVVVFSVSSPLKYIRLLDTTWKDYAEHIDVQLKSIISVVGALKEHIHSKSNDKIKFIVLLTESCVGSPPKGLSPYVTAKYAAMGLSKSIAVELAQYGCTVNMVSPGMVETNLLGNFPPKLVEMTAYENPQKRNGKPNDVANVVSFLASDSSDYLNGVHITINGGRVML